MSLEITSHSPEDTQRIGEKLGNLAQAGDIFLLVGNLGTGKTCLTQGIAWGLDIEGYASSPSFVVIKEYQGRLPLYHIDLYRLDQVEEVVELGLDEYFTRRGVCVVEWAEKGLGVLPEEHLLIRISFLSQNERSLQFDPYGGHYPELVSKLQIKLCN